MERAELSQVGAGHRTTRERHAYAAKVMADTRAFLTAVGPHGATEKQLRARNVGPELLDETFAARLD